MKQYLLTIIAVLAAIILALFSIDTRPVATGTHGAYQRVCQPIAENMSVIPVGANHDSPLQGRETVPENTTHEPSSPVETQNLASLHHTEMMTLSSAEVPSLDAGMVNVTPDAAGYRLAPEQFLIPNSSFQIAIPYDPSLLPQGFTEDDIQTYVYDRQYHRWVAIQRDSVNEAELLVCSRFRPWEKGLPHTQNDLANPQDALAQLQDMMSFAPQGEGGGDSPLDFINAVLKTPEMPETSAYTPTSIKELKAADPLEGMTLIQPPTANNSGTANLSYPIEIPAGRQGMQPNLALTYSSGGGNGWLGVGWDIPIPSITVETRWGVPRYRTAWESEVYVYEGEQLVTKDGTGEFRKMAHRTNDTMSISRLSGNVQHFPRKNEAFDSIVRHGDSPSNYWWSVTHKNGVTDYYGKSHNSDNVDYNAVLCDPASHNIAQWMLTESVDPSGNWVRYYYHKEYQQTVFSPGALNKGVQICPDSIRYTGHNMSDPKYSVRFNLNGNNRSDIITNERYGFREVTAVTLCNVEVLYKDTILRRYYFVTENNRESNYKTRLTDLVRMDSPDENISCENIFNPNHWTTDKPDPGDVEWAEHKYNMLRYNFSYFDYPNQNSLYSPAKTISNLESDGISSAFSSNNVPTTALGSTRGSSASFGGTVSVGVANKNFVITDFNVGGNFNYGHSSTEGLLTLVDLNGDGLADKVYKRYYGVYYRPQIIDETDSLTFHYGDEVYIPDIYDFLFEESHQPSLGVQGSVMAVVAASAGIPSTISTTSTYFTDINGDGLPDLVTDRGALFNSLDSDGNPTFTNVNSYRTDPDNGNVNTNQMIVTSATVPCGGIIFDGVADSSIFCDYTYLKDSIRCFSPECEEALSYLMENNPSAVPIEYRDGYYYYYHTDTSSVSCGPVIKEPDIEAVRVWVAPFEGHINITSNIRMLPEQSDGYFQSRFTDGVNYIVEHNNGCWVDSNLVLHAQDTSVLITGALESRDTYLVNQDFSVAVDKYDILFFRLQSKDGRTYDNVEWKVDIQYDDIQGIDLYGKDRANYHSDSDFVLTGQHLFQAPKRGTVTLSGKLTGNPGADSGKLHISHGALTDSSLTIFANTDTTIFLNKSFELDSGQVVMLEIKGSGGNIDWGRIECQPYLTFQEDPSNQPLSIPDELSCYPPVRLDIHHPDTSDTITAMRKFFGPLYRGWGQFAHKNDLVSVNRPIEVASLRLPAYISNSSLTVDSATFASAIASAIDTSHFHIDTVDNTTDITVESMSSMIDSIFNPLSDNTRWVEMTPDMEHYRWAGFSNTTAVSRGGMSNTRPVHEIPVLNGDEYPADMTVTQELIEYDHPVPVSVDGYPVQTIRKMNVSVMGNGSLSVVADDGVSLSTGNSVSGGANFVVSDYLDLNGDRYPDLLCKKQVQYTMPWGGIGAKQVLDPDHDELCNSNTRSGGATFSGSYPVPKRQAGGNAQKAKITIEGLGGSLMDGTDETAVMYLDMNGDGLPDRVYEDGYVALNRGYGFDIKEMWSAGTPRMGSTVNTSSDLGANFGLEQVSIGGGLGRNQSENVTEMQLMDFNGDGLPDKVLRSGNGLRVSYNYGNGYWSLQDTIVGVPHISQSHSYSETGNGALTLGFEIPPWVKIQAGIQLTPYNSSFSRDNAQLTDINGDGYPDYVTSDSEESMTIRYNTAGKTNLLKKVTNFTGSTISLDYDMPLSCYEKPQRSWNLASVEVEDPASPLSAARSLTRFSYADPHYNRYERMDFGYGWVKTSQFDTENNDSLYRYTVEEFENRSFTKRGRKLRDCVYDSANRPFVEHRYFATVYDRDDEATVDTGCVREELYVGHETELTLYYEGNPVPTLVTRTDREYDSYRNVVGFSFNEDSTQYSDLFHATIEYATGMPYNLVSLPVRIVVANSNDDIVQKRTAQYFPSGKLRQLANYSSLSDSSVHNFSYDSYGCLSESWLPDNRNNQRLHYHYHYDPEVHTYPVHITNNSLGFTSTAEYDYKFGKPVRTTDINGNDMRYKYDYMGRLLEILAPYEADNGVPYTIRMTYIPKNYDRLDIFTPDNMQNYACTFHYDPANPDNELRTVVITDGLGRLLQTKKDAEIAGGEKVLVTGRVEYDCFGRTVAQYHPFTEDLGTENIYNDSVTAGTATTVRYDILDRQTYTRTPMGYVTTMTYDFDTCMGRQCFRTSVTDPMNNTVKTLTGTLGQQLKQIAPMNTVTRFEYDCLGRLKKSTDPDNISTYYDYDWFSQLTHRRHPDAGDDWYKYDPAGNLTEHVNALGDSIKYRYHFNQLTDVEYPRFPANNVHYTYGTPGNVNINAVGKVIRQEDASGLQTFKYGKLGEIIENIRTFALPFESKTYTFKMQYEYDSWNRIQTMTYPDGEVVTYGYNQGGMLKSVVGNKNGVFSDYIKEIHYNKYELKDTVTYGNGTGVRYMYDSILRLSHLRSACADGTMQDIAYTYDAAGNIQGIQNTAAALPNGLGGAYRNTYKYDDLYRLSEANCGRTIVEMSYHANGRIQRKTVKRPITAQEHERTAYVVTPNEYTYNINQPNTLKGIRSYNYHGSSINQIVEADSRFRWDGCGNMVFHEDVPGNLSRNMVWAEENRLLLVADNSHLSLYLYDAGGERAYKLTGDYHLQNTNGHWFENYTLTTPTLYASPYLVANRQGYTKHYYAGSERVASRIGGGGLADLDWNAAQHRVNGAWDNATGQVHSGHRLLPSLPSDLLAGLFDWQDSVQPENDCYWYHPDHLGSASWVTDADGSAVQHLEYLPWGEDLVDQRLNSFDGVRYTFSAKEKDTETGYSYFGARYYSSDLSIWLSVDPMSDKYPSLSPYVYCADNPIKLVDPNGEEIGNYYNIDGDYLGTDGIDDCKTYLVWNLQDISFDENGKIVPQEINDIVELPSQEVRQQMIILMKEFDANNPNAEWGGLCGNNMYDDGSISDYYSIRWGTPGEAVPCGKGDKMHYNPKSAKKGWFHVALEFHTHGSGICENNIFWDQRPSDDDIDFCKNWAVWTGRSAKSAVFGMKDNVIHFYNEDGAISKPMSFDVFLSIPDNW